MARYAVADVSQGMKKGIPNWNTFDYSDMDSDYRISICQIGF